MATPSNLNINALQLAQQESQEYPAAMADSKKAVEDEVEMAPDPDEDDLDDLDGT